jgi:hypothetical protein
MPVDATQSLDRHALAVAIWLCLGFVAIVLFKFGLGAGGTPYIFAASLAVVVAFLGHVIVNVIYRTSFTRGELALGLVAYAIGLLSFGFAILFWPLFRSAYLMPTGVGLVVIFVVVAFYLVTVFGLRRTFGAFDVIRDFKHSR